MGMWGSGIFEDDLALDIKGAFDAAVEVGATPADAAVALMEGELPKDTPRLEELAELRAKIEA